MVIFAFISKYHEINPNPNNKNMVTTPWTEPMPEPFHKTYIPTILGLLSSLIVPTHHGAKNSTSMTSLPSTPPAKLLSVSSITSLPKAPTITDKSMMNLMMKTIFPLCVLCLSSNEWKSKKKKRFNNTGCGVCCVSGFDWLNIDLFKFDRDSNYIISHIRDNHWSEKKTYYWVVPPPSPEKGLVCLWSMVHKTHEIWEIISPTKPTSSYRKVADISTCAYSTQCL